VENDSRASPASFSLADFVASHRILVSRLFAAAFFGALLVTASRLEGSIVADLLFFTGLALVGVATIGRLWCSLYISGHKNAELVTVGPYSVTRNPLYFFSFIGFVGVGFATEMLTFAAAMAAFFAVVYPLIIAREEAVLEAKFADAYRAYRDRVPRFFPNAASYMEPPTWTVDTRRFRRTMRDVVWFVWLVALAELVEAIHEFHLIEPLISFY
jgi:protein-S-isoprenylcysteine O-methyltransferase Ste14